VYPRSKELKRRFLINESDLSSLKKRQHVVDHQAVLRILESTLRKAECLLGNNNSSWVFKRALRKDRPNAVDRHRPDTAETVNAAFA
jgi:hypothetical protein